MSQQLHRTTVSQTLSQTVRPRWPRLCSNKTLITKQVVGQVWPRGGRLPTPGTAKGATASHVFRMLFCHRRKRRHCNGLLFYTPWYVLEHNTFNQNRAKQHKSRNPAGRLVFALPGKHPCPANGISLSLPFVISFPQAMPRGLHHRMPDGEMDQTG